MNAARALLKQGRSALLLCDMQERNARITYDFQRIIQNSAKLITGLKMLEVPMIVAEQTPEVLGKTVSELDISSAKGPFAKTHCSMYIPPVLKELSVICSGEKPDAVILIGMETHVCVELTAIDLKINEYEVHVVADCTTSHTQEEKMYSLERMRGIGCHITTVENVLLKLLRDSTHKEFKNVIHLTRH
ncbi:isochorismatase domain-containing protein 1-like [Hylaeus anthracinus]|uniref:isochorismatase domain-containing protein 1-like n=1 Tax=Hylaeus anthracinus TaxID=313031 RepID=UPI0023B9D836|nr:isochorismatase domain-containing protein 1-like [Hylaeus anthracinus]